MNVIANRYDRTDISDRINNTVDRSFYLVANQWQYAENFPRSTESGRIHQNQAEPAVAQGKSQEQALSIKEI
jgi:hypothetical protein